MRVDGRDITVTGSLLQPFTVYLGLVLASGACWVGAQFLEALQWEDDGPAPGYTRG